MRPDFSSGFSGFEIWTKNLCVNKPFDFYMLHRLHRFYKKLEEKQRGGRRRKVRLRRFVVTCLKNPRNLCNLCMYNKRKLLFVYGFKKTCASTNKPVQARAPYKTRHFSPPKDYKSSEIVSKSLISFHIARIVSPHVTERPMQNEGKKRSGTVPERGLVARTMGGPA